MARGLLASLLLAGFVAFFLVSTLTGPFQELHFVPIQNTRTPDDQTPYGSLMYPSVWGVTFVSCQSTIFREKCSSDAINSPYEKFSVARQGISNNTDWQPIASGYTSAVNVTPLWDSSSEFIFHSI